MSYVINHEAADRRVVQNPKTLSVVQVLTEEIGQTEFRVKEDGSGDIFMEDTGSTAANNHRLWEERRVRRTLVWGTQGRNFPGLETAGTEQSRQDFTSVTSDVKRDSGPPLTFCGPGGY